MLKKLVAVALMSVVYVPQGFADQTLTNTAFRTIQQTNNDLQRCGLQFAAPNSRGLPYPPRDARYAIVNRFGRLLAYYRENTFGYTSQYYYSNPNGTFPHFVELRDDQLRYSIPGSMVASADRVFVPGGVGYNLYCRDTGYARNWPTFTRCVDRNFVHVITSQLCRWSNSLGAEGFGY